MEVRDTYKYHLKRGGKIVHRGITNDLNRREADAFLVSFGCTDDIAARRAATEVDLMGAGPTP